MNDKSKRKGNTKNEGKNVLEWMVFATSVFLVAAILAYLSYKTVTHTTSPPDILIEYNPDPTNTTPYCYHVKVKNAGGETAEQVTIELILKNGNSVLEKAELQLSFVPQASEREGWLIFSQDPEKADTLIARVVGFKKP